MGGSLFPLVNARPSIACLLPTLSQSPKIKADDGGGVGINNFLALLPTEE
jgi:hypothetical protein